MKQILLKFYNKAMLIKFGIIILATICLSGCGKEKGTIIGENGEKVKYETDRKTTTLETENGSIAAGEDIKLPVDFPKNIPVYNGIKLSVAWSGNSEEINPSSENIKAGYSGTADKACNEVKEWYKSEFKKLGWQINLEAGSGLYASNATEISSPVFTANGSNCEIAISVMDKAEMSGSYEETIKQAKEMDDLQKEMDAMKGN